MEVVSAVENTAPINQELECSSIEQVSDTVSGDPSQPLLTDKGGTALQSSAPQQPKEDTNRIIENLFSSEQISKMHHFHKCRNTGCNGFSNEEEVFIKMIKKKDRFQHE